MGFKKTGFSISEKYLGIELDSIIIGALCDNKEINYFKSIANYLGINCKIATFSERKYKINIKTLSNK